MANPNAVFPEITKSVAGAECAQWYALALACLSLASFLCQRGVQSSDTNRLKNACLPTTASMFLYHVGVAWFQARQIFGTKVSVVAVGALLVHAPLAACFAFGTVFCVADDETKG